MESDEDLFMSQSILSGTQCGRKQGKNRDCQISSSCPPRPSFVYDRVILFNWKEGLKKPFQIYPLDTFQENELRPEWIKNTMMLESRKRKLKAIKCLPGTHYSLFGKIEASK